MLAIQVRLRQGHCPPSISLEGEGAQLRSVDKHTEVPHSKAHSSRSVQELRPQERHTLESLKQPGRQGQPPKDGWCGRRLNRCVDIEKADIEEANTQDRRNRNMRASASGRSVGWRSPVTERLEARGVPQGTGCAEVAGPGLWGKQVQRHLHRRVQWDLHFRNTSLADTLHFFFTFEREDRKY